MSDGGPAFPNAEIYHPVDGSAMWQGSGGMSLRDYFAAAALQGFLAQYKSSRPPELESVAKEAYRHADAMLKVRLQPQRDGVENGK